MSNSKTAKDKLEFLLSTIENDILSMSDDEVLEEVNEGNIDLDTRANNIRQIISEEITNILKKRLYEAKENYREESEKQQIKNRLVKSADEAIELIKSIIETYGESIPKDLTLAFREGKGMSENDLISFIEDLEELGLLDKNGE